MQTGCLVSLKPIEKLMKKLIALLAAVLLIITAAQSQDRELKRLFNRYQDVPGFEMKVQDPGIDMEINTDFDLLHFIDKIEKLYILSFDREKGDAGDLVTFKRKLDKLIGKKDFNAMIDISGDGSVRILTRKNSNDKTTDLLLITEGDDEAMFFWAGS